MYRDIERTIKSIEKYSKRDAHTWNKIFNSYLKNKDAIIISINSPPKLIIFTDKGYGKERFRR